MSSSSLTPPPSSSHSLLPPLTWLPTRATEVGHVLWTGQNSGPLSWQWEAPAALSNPGGTEQQVGSRRVTVLPISQKTKRKAHQAPLKGLCPAAHSHGFSEAAEQEQHRCPRCASHHSCQATELSTAVELPYRLHRRPLEKNSPMPRIKTSSRQPALCRESRAPVRAFARHVPSGQEQAVTSRLQRSPMDSQQEVQISFSDRKACASQGWQQNKFCMHQGSAPEQLSSNL